jgi:hypothetical protein
MTAIGAGYGIRIRAGGFPSHGDGEAKLTIASGPRHASESAIAKATHQASARADAGRSQRHEGFASLTACGAMPMAMQEC